MSISGKYLSELIKAKPDRNETMKKKVIKKKSKLKFSKFLKILGIKEKLIKKKILKHIFFVT